MDTLLSLDIVERALVFPQSHVSLMEEGYLSIVLFSLVNKETALAL